MAEGGAFPWKRQVIDESRGPAGSYKSMSLPDLPDGVKWQQNETTKEWTLIRINQKEQERASQLYRLERTTVWNPNTGREQLSVKPVLKEQKETTTTMKEMPDTATVATTTSEDGEVEEGDRPPHPVLGKDYVVHTVLPSDTFSGLCLRYKISATTLRRVNQFSGTNLALAPSKLLIPLLGGMTIDKLTLQDTNSREYKMQLLLNEFPSLAAVERKAYLEMNDWDITKTIEEIKQGTEWEQNHICVAVPLEVETK